MSLADDIGREQDERAEWLKQQAAKCGDYTGEECPNCKRVRVMLGQDGLRRCEKCCWCIESATYDGELSDYMR